MLKERNSEPSAMVLDSRTLLPTPESDSRAGDNKHWKNARIKVHIAMGAPGNLRSIVITAANGQERDQVGQQAADAVAEHEIELDVIKHTEA